MTTISTYEKAEKIKNKISGLADHSKEVIRKLISENKKQMSEALDSNSEMLKKIQKKLDMQEVNEEVSGKVRDTFVKSFELAEDTLDAIINAYTRQMEFTVDFNTKLVEAVKDSEVKNADKFLDLIHENLNAAQKLTANNTHEILSFYNKHTNLVLNFNSKFADNVTAQIEALYQVQNKGLERFTKWAQDMWWEKPRTESKAEKENA